MIVLGLGFTGHDASAALAVDGELKVAIAKERLTRLKRDGVEFGSGKLDLGIAVQYCLESQGLKFHDVDLVVWNPTAHWSGAELTIRLAREGGMDLSGKPLLPLPHHFAHACCAFYLSPFPEAAVLVTDGAGGPMGGLISHCRGPERESLLAGRTCVQSRSSEPTDADLEHESFYYCDGERWTTLRKVVGPLHDGIGGMYGLVSKLLFGSILDAGKTMGLAPYGQPDGLRLLECAGTGDMPFVRGRGVDPGQPTVKERLKLWRKAAAPLNYEDPLPSGYAAAIQHEAEEALLAEARWLHDATGSKHLCLSGGVALNCVANSLLARQSGFDDVFVPPAPGDDGIAVGCALYGAILKGGLRRGPCPVFLGHAYSATPDEFLPLGLVPAAIGADVTSWLAEQIAAGQVIAWYQGGAELGPRALGHRSFLADPRRPEMRDHLNITVKNRETFRPFAPVVLEEAVMDYFEEYHPSYFMSFVATVREEKRHIVPAITHVDGTARYQVLRKADNPELYRLIGAFARHTGVPLLLNTSFNRAGEPIVETPLEAARCMLASSADLLVLEDKVYRRA